MKKIALLSLSLIFVSALTLAARETVLWEGLFNEFETDNMLCGLEDPFSGYMVDEMTGNCAPSTGDSPFADEIAIVEDSDTGSKYLKVCRRDLDEDSPGCRGARTKLIWGEGEEETEYDPSKGFLKIEGRVKAAPFTELRIANVNGACMARFGLNGGPDNKNRAYLAHYGYNLGEIVSDAVNKGDERFYVSSGDLGLNLAKFKGIPADGNWYNFEICFDLSVCDLAYFTVWSDDQSYFDIYRGRCNALTYQGYRPTYICFTSWAKNNEPREASYFSNLKVSYVVDDEEENWETFFEDDFSQYSPGQSLFNVNPEFIQVGDNAPNLEATIIDYYDGVGFESNAVYFAVNNDTEATPKCGIAVSVPRDMFDYPGAKVRMSLKAYYNDGGIGFSVLNEDERQTMYFGRSKADETYSHRYYLYVNGSKYDCMTLGDHNAWKKFVIELFNDEEGKTHLYGVANHMLVVDHYDNGMGFDKYYPDVTIDYPNMAGIQLEAKPNETGEPRFLLLKDVKYEVQVPEPFGLVLLTLAVPALLRKRG